MNIKDDAELINYFSKTRKLQKSTYLSYKTYIKQYTEFNQKTMIELLQEAEDEEEQGIRWKHRTLRKRLIEFRAYLYDNYAYSTAKSRFSKLLAFYKHFEIEIHQLPKISTINADKTHMGFKDLPDKGIIKKALKVANPVMRAIILFMSSSGSARAETRNLTIQDFIDATNNKYISYHQSDNIYEVINQLKNRDDITPIFHMKRQKTNKYYYTFCSPEASSEIINYLSSRTVKLTPETPLFDVSQQMFSIYFREINNKLGLGKLDNRRAKFTSHMLRKFHSTSLWNEKVSVEIVDTLQGRGKDQTHSSYFWENPLKLRELYIDHMDCLTINLDVNSLSIKSPEFVKLETENVELRKLNDETNKRMDDLEKLVLGSISSEKLAKLHKLL
mgnify:FL=1